jgi:hypothetical protein
MSRKVYGPYKGKDGRERVIIRENGKNKTISYPKFLVESMINRPLLDNETVDHIDGNFCNNDPSNLRIVDRRQHCSEDVIRIKPEIIIRFCVMCGKVIKYDTSKRRQRTNFCSKQCSGKYGKSIQNGSERKLFPPKPKHKYHKLKDTLKIEPLIGNNQSGLLDNGEPCKMATLWEPKGPVETRYRST